MPPEPKQVDVTRWNRKERRDFRKRAHLTITGRNLPFQKEIHGTLTNYNALREKELNEDTPNGTTS